MLKQLIVPLLFAAGFSAGALPPSPPAQAQTLPAADSALSSSVSQNWAGYVADSATYTAVGGSWRVPQPSSSSGSLSTDATWVGIGGVKSDDLIQAGTQALIQGGKVTYEAWYELLPGYQHVIPLQVNGGDSVTVSLTELSPGQWYLFFENNTTGQSYSTTLQYDSSLSSAEWIEEMPVVASGRGGLTYVPLDDFGTVQFTGAYAVARGARVSLAQSGAQSLTMASGRGMQTLAAPSSFLADDSFSVSRESGAVTQAPTATYVSSRSTTVTRSWHGRGGGRTIIISFGF